jgi:hypothetical protein
MCFNTTYNIKIDTYALISFTSSATVVCAGLKVECKDTALENAGLVERDGLLLGEFECLGRIIPSSYVFSFVAYSVMRVP